MPNLIDSHTLYGSVHGGMSVIPRLNTAVHLKSFLGAAMP